MVRLQMIAMRNCTALGQSPLRDMVPACGVCSKSMSSFEFDCRNVCDAVI